MCSRPALFLATHDLRGICLTLRPVQDQTARITVGLSLLVALWIAVYWWWPVSDPTPITVAPPEAQGVPAKPPVTIQLEPIPAPKPAEQPLPPPPPPSPVVIPPKFHQHTVRKGETYASISLRYYGTSAHATAISKANPLLSPPNLREGRVILVPHDPRNIQGLPVAKAPSGNDTVISEYTVEKGDTLSRIAATVYGDSKLAGHIFEANKDQLPDEHSLRIGQKLRIPPAPPKP